MCTLSRGDWRVMRQLSLELVRRTACRIGAGIAVSNPRKPAPRAISSSPWPASHGGAHGSKSAEPPRGDIRRCFYDP